MKVALAPWDAGERYLPTYYDDGWVRAQFGDCGPAEAALLAEHDRLRVLGTGLTLPVSIISAFIIMRIIGFNGSIVTTFVIQQL